MGAFVVQQPNGLYCRFSTVVDCPTHWNMTKEEYIQSRMDDLKEELEMSFEYRLKPFEWVKEYFTTNNMSQIEFKRILESMNEPVESVESVLNVDSKSYNKAIDDFTKYLLSNDVIDKSVIRRIAEQLRKEKENECI